MEQGEQVKKLDKIIDSFELEELEPWEFKTVILELFKSWIPNELEKTEEYFPTDYGFNRCRAEMLKRIEEIK